MKLTDRQKVFCEEYLIDLNATQAAIRAGYSPATANRIGSRLLTNVVIRARIEKAMAERSKRTGINADRVLRELARIAFVNAADVIDFQTATIVSGASEDDTAAIASFSVKTIPTADGEGIEREIRLFDKLKALELLGKHLGLFNNDPEVNTPVTIIVNYDYGEGKEAQEAE